MKLLFSMILAGALAGISTGAEEVAKDKPIKVGQAAAEIASGSQLLDVRTKEEWDEGHLKGAKLVTLSDEGFADKAKAVIDTRKPVVVYCHSGKRSAKAAKLLHDAGFTTVHDMAGGIVAWEKEGKAVVK
ncbi:MAG: rhodanese-like domain-containing protein [Luteolibacter sp.]|uniref:rhodanese-like domain-containing protein n=1 Tax=Luteolibacter sp. TaxID=1962973 RepID=UPI003265B84E